MHTVADESRSRRIEEIGRANPRGPSGQSIYLEQLDYSVLQQCIHCGMCLPTCPTYDATKLERNSPRGRIALMRSVADGALPVSRAFGEEMYFCLGCLTCETVCPAGVRYGEMFEHARADIEHACVLKNPQRQVVRALTLRLLFTRPRLLRFAGRLLRFYERSGVQRVVRKLKLIPGRLRELELLTPRICSQFSDELIAERETPEKPRYRVGVLTGCVQDLAFAHVNRDTVDALLANGCEVITPRAQPCCGSLHAHNGELELSRELARRNIDAIERAAGSIDSLDAIISNAAGCGSHLKNYAHLLENDPRYSARAAAWARKLRDICEWLVECGVRVPERAEDLRVTYHEACHLCHGQKITRAPREVLCAIAGLTLVELPESTWCCGSAGIYNITQPEMSAQLLDRKLRHIDRTSARIVATANPGCIVQLEAGARKTGRSLQIVHPVSLLAAAYRRESR